MRLSVVLLLFLNSSIAFSQHTITLAKGESSPSAKLSDISWIQGHWTGEAFGGITEEIWSPPAGDSMMFVFRLIVDDKIKFYEAGHIQQTDGTLILRLKHFHGDFKGWEEKDDTVDFKLVRIDAGRAYFDNFTFEKVSEKEMNIYVVIGDKDGKTNEVKFNYKKL